MTWLLILASTAVVAILSMWVIFVYIAVRGLKSEIPNPAFGPGLDAEGAATPAAMTILVPIDGSTASVAAVQEVAHCQLPAGSTIELLYAIHSRLPVLPDFPPWAVTIAAAHGESLRAQTRHAPEVLDAAANYLHRHQPQVTVVKKTVEGVPTAEILREAAALGAHRIVIGSHGRGRGQRLILGSTAAAVASGAPCTVQIARPRSSSAHSLAGSHAA
ncbi:MAG: universal stress protein [Vicinamibacterales bacterium]